MNQTDQTTDQPASLPKQSLKRRWPEGAVVYQIYPRSLQDSNNDGIGDLPGIISRLEYLQGLGVTAIWLSPFYPSPMADFGYDVSDYCDVDPQFGTLDDFKQLQAKADELHIKIIVDLVPNHTSDQHAWFRASRQSMNNGFSDWYIWRDGRIDHDGHRQPPNNWLDALTGRSAWEWDAGRQQYYLHSFHKGQPDLNWANQAVREAMKDVLRFWLDLGVDGFRVDAVYWMAKDPMMRDDDPADSYIEGEDSPYLALKHNNSHGWPAVYSHLNELAGVLKEPAYQQKDRFMVTEAYPAGHSPVAEYMAFYEGVDPQVAAPFNFEGVSLPWRAHDWHRFLKTFHQAMATESKACVASYAFGNHDKPRLASRIGSDAARSAAVMLLTLPGMAFVYYGEELGMRDVPIPLDKVQDPGALGDPSNGMGRDPARTPMQWTSGRQAGFSQAAETWLPIAQDYFVNNVDSQSSDPDSSLSLYRQLGRLRQQSPALKYGDIQVLDNIAPNCLAYVRSHDGISLLTAINFSDQIVQVATSKSLGDCLVTTHVQKQPITTEADSSKIKAGQLTLLPHQGVVYAVAT